MPELWKTHKTRFPQARWTAHRTRRPQRPTGPVCAATKNKERRTQNRERTESSYNDALTRRRLTTLTSPASLRSDHDRWNARSRWTGRSDHDGWNAHLVGTSCAGQILTMFASQHSDRLSGLVYLDGASDPTTPAYDPPMPDPTTQLMAPRGGMPVKATRSEGLTRRAIQRRHERAAFDRSA